MKQCTKCQITKDVVDFYKDGTTKDGLARWCKPCTKDYEAQRRANGKAPKAKAPVAQAVATANGYTYVAPADLVAVWQAVQVQAARTSIAPNLLFLGPSGCGKTEAAAYIAHASGVEFTKVDAAAMTDPDAWFGTREIVAVDGVPTTQYRASSFVEALQKPGVLLIDEINRVQDAHRNILLPLLDTTRQVTNPLTGEIVKRHPGCFVVMSGNWGLAFTGTYAVDPALMTRALVLKFDYLAAEHETKVVAERTGCTDETAELFVRFANEARTRARMDEDFPPISTREVIEACHLVACGATPDLAATVTVINSAPTDGGPESVQAALTMIWAGIRNPRP